MNAFWEIVASNSLVVLVLAVGVTLLGRLWKNPAALHVLWVLVLAKLVTPPLVTVPIPLPVTAPGLATEEQRASHSVRNGPVVADVEEAVSIGPGEFRRRASPDETSLKNAVPAMASAPSVATGQGTDWLTMLAWTWGIGTSLISLGHGVRIIRFRHLLRAGQCPSSTVLSAAERIAKRLDLSRIPAVSMLPIRISPLVWSLGGRPRVLLPAALFERLDPDAQESILAWAGESR